MNATRTLPALVALRAHQEASLSGEASNGRLTEPALRLTVSAFRSDSGDLLKERTGEIKQTRGVGLSAS